MDYQPNNNYGSSQNSNLDEVYQTMSVSSNQVELTPDENSGQNSQADPQAQSQPDSCQALPNNDHTNSANSVWVTLNSVNTNNAVKVTPDGIKYIPWSQAWRMLKDKYPDAREEITEFPEYERAKDGRWYATGRTVDYRKTSAGVQVEVSIVIGNQRFICRRPVCAAGGFNKIIMNPNYNDINTAQMRCLVKAIAMAGLGLNLYYGEDFEEGPQSPGQGQQFANFRRVGNRPPQGNQVASAPQQPNPQASGQPRDLKVNTKSDLLKLGQRTMFRLPNGQTISAASLLLKAFEERRNAQANGGEVGMYYNAYHQLAGDKRNQELFSQLSMALGLKK